MHAAAERPEFQPPPEPGLTRSLAFALLAHLLLVLALSVGVQWKRDDTAIAVEAELWSPTVQQAAPKAVEAPPPPPPPPPAQEKPVPPPPPPTRNDADIALEREKQRLAQEKERQEEAARQKAAERRRAEEAKKQELARQKAEEAKKQELARQKTEELRKRDEQAKAKARQQQEDERMAKMREENLKRIQGLAGATGGPSATGTATRSSGPSDSYAGRIRARVKPNIVFTEDVRGNPTAEVEVRMAPDGTIVGKRIAKSSGSPTWDDAVLRALDRTEVLPRDVDGRVHTPILLVFRPKD
ncbi:MAG TPA: cell envelope integrity protein TolA [Ramlibacter sp.]|jgi:colicin import membrane protein|uniref:cell envelope integrity protein TolA n=1 Tax=Ramlibacter sp. TaxID=1917967 RepID=UPI002D681AB4|nr:cell envelope integrity protein TolA [Ramlibacter sp.]HZY19511.1 cell envelope integrity protein TolA [Ramlibacter sp.]